MRKVRTLGLLGTGVIGGGWAARAMHFGIDVIAADVKPEMEEWIRGAVENAEVSRHTAPDVIIASSTSGLTPTDLQRDMVGPERFCVAHPFNPVYLLPLVELVPGARTAPATIEAAAAFFTHIGMHALRVRREVPGHLTDRLQEAMWREILHMVNEDVATTGELDESIIYGPGLRWAAMGMNLIYHLAGGETGMRHMLHQFGPALKWPWTKLEAPELTEKLIDRMVEGTQEQAAGRSIRELERLRDNYLVAIQQVLRQFDIGAGSTLRKLEERLYRDAGGSASADGSLLRYETLVRPEWVDYNGHMSDFLYGHVFGEAMDSLYRGVGIDDAFRKTGRMYYTVESHVKHLAEAKVGDPLYATTQILALDDKRLHVFHRLYRKRDDALIATAEQMHLFVDTARAKSASIDTALRARLDPIREAHASLPVPSEVGRPVGKPVGEPVGSRARQP
jgi:carnitine 3-dehydrogenase